MQTTYSGHDGQEYTFDPSAIIKIISENPKIGLALVQVPINIANTLLHRYNNLKWKDNPTKPGYYWVKSVEEVLLIKEYSSKDIDMIVSTSTENTNKNRFQFAGPIEPPE
jgi:hypothetical protein